MPMTRRTTNKSERYSNSGQVPDAGGTAPNLTIEPGMLVGKIVFEHQNSRAASSTALTGA